MIKSITIKDVPPFDHEGAILKELNKINIIYGSNGTGKSTISKILHSPLQYPNCCIEWDNGSPMEVVAYNKDFCVKNFVEQMPGIFTLGEANNVAISKIKEKKECIDNSKQIVNKFKTEAQKQSDELSELNTSFKEEVWKNLYKPNEEWFPKSSIKAISKDVFLDTLLKTYQSKSADDGETLDSLKKRANALFNGKPTTISEYSCFSNDLVTEDENNRVWLKKIIGKDDVDIAGLIRSLGNSDWIHQGLSFLSEGSDVCPFCQQHTITDDFKSQIEDFFNEDYKHSIDELKGCIESYAAHTRTLMSELNNFITLEKSKERQSVNFEQLEILKTALNSVISSNKAAMENKLKEPSRAIVIESTSVHLKKINNLIIKANEDIEKNNNLVNNYPIEKESLINSIWLYYVKSYKTNIKTYYDKCSSLNKAIDSLETEIKEGETECSQLDIELQNLEKNVTSVKPTIDEINRMLKGFGFTNFHIQEVPDNANCYQIVRENGESAKDTLSEGEATFITFLYYMQLIKGSYTAEGVSKDRVLVIDDPVSSLDSNILFIVSTMLRELFSKVHEGRLPVKQVILLTHNVYFHKEVSFIQNKCDWKGNVYHWILRKNDNVSSLQAYQKENPIKSSYELLWNEYKNSSNTSCIVVQNIMRRIIENYFKVFGGISEESIWKKFDVIEDRQICKSLLSWANEGSHCMSDDLFVENSEDQLQRLKDVFHRIFTNQNQESHYDMMMHNTDKD